MERRHHGFMWMSIILEISLIMGIALYGLIHPGDGNDRVDEGSLVRSEAVDSFLLSQKEELATEEGYPSDSEGGPYIVPASLHVSFYRAKNGDNLWTIARKNGLDWFTLLSINRLKKANDISLGQRVKIPNQRGILHVLKEGETLEDVALNYNVNIRKIIRVNRILDPDNIKKGTDIFVPGAKVTQAFGNELMKTSGIPPQFAWPCRRCRTSSGFGYRKDPFTGRRAFHSGIDLASGYGARVNASMDGVVTYAGWMGGYGKLVVIRHKGNYTTRYGHLSSILVRRNRRVRQGQRIGYTGNTGRSTGPHLHFEVRKNGKPLNPIKIIR
jgi:murein DD-endopeptidase MepM/ murein hydrolase activator NlpD